jgi:small acid-soluble spore protein (thioredoxin-like protein)
VGKKKNKSNNALSLGRMIENAKENIEEAEISMEFAEDELERENLEDKNARRRTSIAIMDEQLKEEAAFNARKKYYENKGKL